MAANPDDFKCEVAQVLSDIPFISVGILAFAVSVLFLVMRTISLSAIFLLFSALLAFIAAVLDLGQTLDGVVTTTTFVASEHVIRAREVLFALSIGFRFLFYWSFVAEPSRKDQFAATARRVWRFDFPVFESSHEPHSASWLRWGLLGKMTAAALLVAIIIVTALQVVWRVVPQFHQYSNVYATDAVLELLVSVLLLLKLLSNTITLSSGDSVLAHTLSEYLVPISGLLFSIVIGVGDLLLFAFTESTVGRLLQALEVYIIVVFVTVTAFLRRRDILLSTTSSRGMRHREALFTLPEPAYGSTFRITPPVVETPRVSAVFDMATHNKGSNQELLRRSARRSLNHVSSWLSFKIPKYRPYYEDDEVKLWNADKARADSMYTGDIDIEPQAGIETSIHASKEWPVRDTTALSTRVGSVGGSAHNGENPPDSRMDAPRRMVPLQVRTSTIPPSSTMSGTKNVTSMAKVPGISCVSGLGGTQSPTSACGSRTLLSETRIRQSVDQSIEETRSLSTDLSSNLSCSNAVLNPRGVQLTRSPSTGQKTVCSEISLSNFPTPPWLAAPVPPLPASSSSHIQRIRGNRRVLLATARVQDTFDLALPRSQTSLANIPGSPHFNSIPDTLAREGNESLSAEAGKTPDLEETRYNVTSFFDNLATPGRPCERNREKPGCLPENESSCDTGSGERLPALARPILVAHSSGTARKNNTSDQLTDGLPPRTRVVGEAGTREGNEQAKRMFVRRGPARLSIQPYDPGRSRVRASGGGQVARLELGC